MKRSWVQGDEEIFLDTATCAMAFRMLRLHGYSVSSDPLSQINKRDIPSFFRAGHSKDIAAAIELYRASEIMIGPDETLEKLHSWSSPLLKESLSDDTFNRARLDKHLSQQVTDTLRFSFITNFERVGNRRNIERYNADSTSILKTSFRWVVENRIDQLDFGRQKQVYCYITAAATFFYPELCDARISWTKNGVLTTVIDDFFDVAGSMEELENLIELVKKWDVNVNVDCCSEHVRILFSALRSTICETAAKAYTVQRRCVRSHIIDIWLDTLNSMLAEAQRVGDKSVPTMDEYIENALVSFALGPIVLLALYLIGPVLPEEIIDTSEYLNLFKHMSTCGRLLNDVMSFKRESKQGKVNAVSLHMIHNGDCDSEVEAIAEINSWIARNRRELLKLVLQTDGSLVPRECKDLFWKMSKACHLFYLTGDQYSSEEMVNPMKLVIDETIVRQ